MNANKSVLTQRERYLKIAVPMNPEEKTKVKNFLDSTGRKATQWVRVLILDAIEKEEAKN